MHDEYLFFLPGPGDDGILGPAILPSNASAGSGIAGAGSRIIRHIHAYHIVECPRFESGASDLVARTGVRNHDQFCTIEHELSCRFREFSIGANHGAHAKLDLCTWERANVERFSRRTVSIAADLLNIR